MISVSPEFEQAAKAPTKEVSGYIVLQDGTEVTAGGDLEYYTITGTGAFLKTAMRKVVCSLLGNHEDMVDTAIDVYYGVKVSGEFEFILIGKFNITKAVYKKDQDSTELTGYDNMLHFTVPYVPVGEYPTTAYGFLTAVCAGAGVVLENETIYNGTVDVSEDFYQNVEEFTFRDVLEDICELAASYALINPEGRLELRQLSAEAVDGLDYENLIDLEVGDVHGGINSLVLSRQPQNDDVYLQDEDDINQPTNRNILALSRLDVTYTTPDGESE